MQEKLFYLEQLALIKDLVAARTPLLNFIFTLLSYFDTEFFSIALVTVLFLGYKRIWGIRMAYMYYISYFFNHSLKHLLQMPRPSALHPDIALDTFYGYGLPSGGAQSAAIVFSLLALMSKNKFRWFYAGLGMIAIAASRVYIGAHFITDVVGGLLVGGVLVIGFYFLHTPIEAYFKKMHWGIKLPLSLVFSLIILFSFLTNGTIRCSGAFTGMSIGLILTQLLRLHPVDSQYFSIRLMRVLLGLFILVSLHLFLYLVTQNVTHFRPLLALFLPHFIIGIWLTVGTAWGLQNHEAINR